MIRGRISESSFLFLLLFPTVNPSLSPFSPPFVFVFAPLTAPASHKYTNTTGFGRSVVAIQEYTPEVLREVFLGGGGGRDE
ncbi:hypothetical protein B0H11DRAFT_2049187 [Mycena galericulata]|nr:hypothetical protein B0H11DRAFT_2049187 [Mycena galericulata]